MWASFVITVFLKDVPMNENCNIIYFLLLRVASANNDHTTYCQIKSRKKVVTDSEPFTKGQFRQMSLQFLIGTSKGGRGSLIVIHLSMEMECLQGPLKNYVVKQRVKVHFHKNIPVDPKKLQNQLLLKSFSLVMCHQIHNLTNPLPLNIQCEQV